jgi:polyisoprenoid-binding protein YceI
MKTNQLVIAVIMIVMGLATTVRASERYVSSKSHIKFFSTTPAEDIEAHNYTSTSAINTGTGNVVFSIPMQGFEFEKALMQRHFNQKDYLDTSTYPTSRLVAKITNHDQIDFTKDGTYDATVEGELTIRGISQQIREQGKLTVKGRACLVCLWQIMA